ncbi:MAG: hypothetical protein HY222_02065 [Thaumarchaeota archaeon]|nr:hypothetical protein [Nitrososphaerota archaeon]MBI3641158.1 hypothetical protein [Nitrososphaerota archaeon]
MSIIDITLKKLIKNDFNKVIFDFLLPSNNKYLKHLREYDKLLNAQLDEVTELIQLYEIRKEESIDYTKQYTPINEEEIRKLIQNQNLISHKIIQTRKEIKKCSSKTILIIELSILPIILFLVISIFHIL